MATAYNYTTPKLVQEELKATDAFTDSTYPSLQAIEIWINEESAIVNRMAGINFGSTQYTQYYDYNGEEDLFLKHAPVITIDTFEYNTASLGNAASWTTKVEDTDFSVDQDRGVVTLISGNFSPSSGKKRMRITYTAGYDDIPYEVQKLATKLVAKRVIDSVLAKDTNERQSGKSISVGSISIVKPAQFGVNQYKELKSDIADLQQNIVKGTGVHRYGSY
jgi:hypothetical protein